MPRRIQCPLENYPEAYIELPDTWLGLHAQRRDETIEKSKGMEATLTTFAVALAILENWSLPGLDGHPDKWEFTQLDLPLIAWVIEVAITDFNSCFIVPKALPLP